MAILRDDVWAQANFPACHGNFFHLVRTEAALLPLVMDYVPDRTAKHWNSRLVKRLAVKRLSFVGG